MLPIHGSVLPNSPVGALQSRWLLGSHTTRSGISGLVGAAVDAGVCCDAAGIAPEATGGGSAPGAIVCGGRKGVEQHEEATIAAMI